MDLALIWIEIAVVLFVAVVIAWHRHRHPCEGFSLVITGGNGLGQMRTIVRWDTTKHTMMLDRSWKPPPDEMSSYIIE